MGTDGRVECQLDLELFRSKSTGFERVFFVDELHGDDGSAAIQRDCFPDAAGVSVFGNHRNMFGGVGSASSSVFCTVVQYCWGVGRIEG